MFGRLTRIVALVAVVSHLWVTVVVAPWHHLVEHRLSLPEASAKPGDAVATRHCRCHHHARPENIDAAGRNRAGQDCDDSSDQQVPACPDSEHSCVICQVLAQPFTPTVILASDVSWERLEFSRPVAPLPPQFGAAIEPVSRGPPVS